VSCYKVFQVFVNNDKAASVNRKASARTNNTRLAEMPILIKQ